MSKRLKTIPKFASEAAERAFWEKNDSTEYLDWKKAQPTVLPNLKPSTQTISLRLPQHLLDSIKTAANAVEPRGSQPKSGLARSRYDQVWRRSRHTAQCGRHGGARIDAGTAPALVLHFLRKTHPAKLHRLGPAQAARRHRGLFAADAG